MRRESKLHSSFKLIVGRLVHISVFKYTHIIHDVLKLNDSPLRAKLDRASNLFVIAFGFFCFFALFRMLCEAILHGYFQRRRDGSRCQYLCIVETEQMLFYVTKRRNDCDRGWKEYD